jgi:transposase
MTRYRSREDLGKDIFVGIDLHLKSWHVTVRDSEVELFSGAIAGSWWSLRLLLERYRSSRIKVVYEAGYFGFSLHDRLLEWGAECLVTPPSLIPQESGNRVKTDRRDSRKLAHLLSRGILKRIWVPSATQRTNRQVIRTRRQLIGDRVRIQLRIKALLRHYGIEIADPSGKWSRVYVGNLRCLKLSDRWLAESFGRLLDQYDFLSEQIVRQTRLLKELSETDEYRKSVEIMQSVYGIGLIGTMEILLEIGDFTRFNRSAQIAAYVGLTPSQYSSGDKIRMGRITGIGKGSVRAILVEASWRLISHDSQMRELYERIKRHSGSKRAIVAVARHLIIRLRRMILDGQPYKAQGQAA